MAPPKPQPASWDADLKMVVVPGRPHTVDTLVKTVLRRARERGITPYKVGRLSGLTNTAVHHFFKGYKGTGEQPELRNVEGLGRVRLDTFLRIVQALGCDIEIVARERPGRTSL